jgi:hypothetical protein
MLFQRSRRATARDVANRAFGAVADVPDAILEREQKRCWPFSCDIRTGPQFVAVSDRNTLRGLTQFLTQFGFSGSATSP